MKIDRHGKAAILTPEDIQLLFSEGLQTTRDRALFGCMLFTGCRIKEACTLLTKDVYDLSGSVRPKLIIRKGNTKGKLATRTIPIIQDLRAIPSTPTLGIDALALRGSTKRKHFSRRPDLDISKFSQSWRDRSPSPYS